MRWILLALSALCLGCWLFFGSYAGPLGLPVPALGPFFHPSSGFWRNAAAIHTYPLQGKLTINHPLAKGDVYFDERSIPHVFADDLESAVFLQGYVTARDRLWQMDISTRSTGGRLAEVLGNKLIERDRKQIHGGFRIAAQHAVTTWKEYFPADFLLIEAYCAGVNAYIAQLDPADYPIEFKLLGYHPQAWTPYHVALMLKGMVQSMTDRNSDAAYTHALTALNEAKFKDLYPKWDPKETPIVPSGTIYNLPAAPVRQSSPLPLPPATALNSGLSFESPSSDQQPTDELSFPLDYHPRNGSNNWAISGSKSPTRKPILAGDPHLGLSLPSIWYEIQLKVGDKNCRGVSLPGMPMVVIGFNQDIAWSMTNGSEDVIDWYKMEWTDDSHQAYRIGTDTFAVQQLTDTIFIKDAEPEIITTPWTRRGPLAVPDDPESAYYLLAKDAGYLYTHTDRPGSEFKAMLQLMEAENYADFKVAMKSYSEPLMNFAYADRHGDIAMKVSGFWPLRPADDRNIPLAGKVVSDGSTPLPNWTTYLPYEHLPAQHNPQRGFVSSANQPPTDANYPYLYYGSFPAWRGRYLNRKLTQGERIGQREVKDLQLDAHSLMAEELLPLLLARINRRQLSTQDMKWFHKLSEWDYFYRADSEAASFFERWRTRTYELTTDEISKEAGFPALSLSRWIALLREKPTHDIFDVVNTPTRETAATLTQRAFDEVLEAAEEGKILSWAVERDSRINHLGRIPGFGTGVLTANGHSSAPNALSGNHGPSWRMVVELGDEPRAWGVLPGGASGNPATANYTAGVEEWSRGRYFDLSFWKDRQEASEKATAHLRFE